MKFQNKIEDVVTFSGVSKDSIIYFIEETWIRPVDSEQLIFDEEDIARIKLIHELRERMGVNDEAVPIILHLIDQLNLILKK